MRHFLSTAAGLTAALLLFLLMHVLIGNDDGFRAVAGPADVVSFIRVRHDERVIPRPPPRPEPPDPPERVEVPTIAATDPAEPPRTPIDVAVPEIPAGRDGLRFIATPRGGQTSGEAIPVVKIVPQWPRDALLHGIEGWVEVAFTILPDGRVADVEVIDSEPRGTFEQATVRAVLKWQFKPRVVDGRPVPRRAAQRIEFRLSDPEARQAP